MKANQAVAKIKTKLLLLLFLLLGVSLPAKAQFVSVSATVLDPTGAPYANCSGDVVFVPSPTATTTPLINGSTFQTDVVIAQCDSFAKLSVVLIDNTLISDGHSGGQLSQWRFNISSQDKKSNFNCTMTISGASMDVSAQLQACAPPLQGGGGGGSAGFVIKSVPCAGAMTFTMAGSSPNTSNTAFTTNLNCNVTSSSVVSGSAAPIQIGAVAQFTLIQDGTGGHTFAWPTNFLDQPGIDTVANHTTNASFYFDGTLWHAQTFPAAGGGNPNPPTGPVNSVQKNDGTGHFAPSSITDDGTKVTIDENLSPKGPNPYVDVTRYGVRALTSNATPAISGITATTTSGQSTVPISTNSCPSQTVTACFLNGDGVVIPNAGATEAIGTPGTPTVTPSNSVVGTGTNSTVAAPAGATNYNYKVFACSILGACSAVTTAGSTTTGAASLGSQSLSITSASKANDVITFNTPSQPAFSAGTVVHVTMTNDTQGFTGWWPVATVTAGGFTVTGVGLDTRNGAPTAPNGTGTGSVVWYNCNHVSWTASTGTPYRYIIQSDRQNPGTFVNIGQSWPVNGIFTDGTLTFDDFGQTMMAASASAIPWWVPAAGGPTNDNWVTTIASGAGTITLTMAANAPNSVAGATIRFDDTPPFVAAVNATYSGFSGPLLKMPISSSGGYVFNSALDLTTNNPSVVWTQGATFNDVVRICCNNNWTGELVKGSSAQFEPLSVTTLGFTSSPGLHITNGLAGGYFKLGFSGQNNGITVLQDGGGGTLGTGWDYINFLSGGGTTDYMGMGFLCRGAPGQSSCPAHVGTVFMQSGTQAMADASYTPSWYCDYCGEFTIDHLMGNARTPIIGSSAAAGGATIRVGHMHWQGGTAPGFTVGGPTVYALALGDGGQIIQDTSSQASVANLTTAGGGNNVICGGGGCGSPSSGQPMFTGKAVNFISSVFGITGQNKNAIAANSSTDQKVTVIGGGNFNSALPIPSTVGAVVSAGGSEPIGTLTYQITWVDTFGLESQPSPGVTVTTTTGNQTVTLTPSAAPANSGITGYFVYRNNLKFTTASPCTTQTATGVNFIANGGEFGPCTTQGLPPQFPGGGIVDIGSGGIASPFFKLPGAAGSAAGAAASITAPVLTTSRTQTLQDATDTFVYRNTTDTLTNKTLTSPAINSPTISSSLTSNLGDFTTVANPGNPAAGKIRLYADSTSGNLTCLTSAGANCLPGGTGTPGGSTTQVQFNSAGAFAGSANLTYTSPALSLGSAAGATGQLKFVGLTSGTVTTQSQDAAGTWTFKWPTSAGTANFPMITDGSGNASWTLLPVAGGGSGAGTFTANALLAGNGTSAFQSLAGSTVGTNPLLKLQPSSASNTALTLDTAATPTADILDVNVNTVKTSWFDSSGFLHTPQTTYTGSGPLSLSGSAGTLPACALGNYIITLADTLTSMAQLCNNGNNFKPIAQLVNSTPTAHGVAVFGTTAPQINFTGAGTSGNVLISGGATADGAYGQLDLANANSHTGILGTANGGTGQNSLAAANIMVGSGAFTLNDCLKSGGSNLVVDAGGACGAGGATSLSGITAATASNSILNGVNPQTWNWALTGSTTAFKFSESAAATGASNILVQASTVASSTALPFQADNNGNGWQLSSVGLLQKVGTGAMAIPGTAKGVVVSQGNTAANTTVTGTVNQLLSFDASGNPIAADPIVSLAFVNIWTAQDVTTTRTSSAIRNPIFSQTGTLEVTWASITGSPSGCTLQIRGVDSQGNVLNNGSTVSVTPANGTTSQTFTAAATLQTAAQISAVFACATTYPTTGTLTLDFAPIPNVNVTNTVAGNLSQLNGTTTDTNSGNKSAGTLRVVIATDQPQLTNKLLVTPDSVALPANQSVNISQMNGVTTSMNNGTTDTGTQRVTISSDSTGQVKETNFPATVDTNNGTTSASTPRVTISSDSTGQVIPAPTTASGDAVSACNILSTATTNSTSCKASAGNFYGYEIYNTTTTIYYLRLYNASAAPTCSSATGFIRTIPIPPAGATGQAGGAISNQIFPVNYTTGIGYCITGGSSSTDNTNAAAGIFGELRFK